MLRIAVLAMVLCGSAAQADTHYVDPNSPNPGKPYTSWKTAATDIQSAANEAEAGDTVQAAAGTYRISSEIVIGKAMTVQGAGADKTTIDAGGKCRGVALGGGATLTGFTVTGGKAREGAGVQCGPGATLANCTLSDNAAERYGGGVCCRAGKQGAPPTLVRDCKIVRNRVTAFMHTDTPWGGGGIYVEPPATVRNCWIEGNEAAQRGGGIWCHSGGTLAENCTIVGNRAKGLRQRNPHGSNSLEEGGGGAFCDFGAELRNCLLYDNTADKIGGGAVLSTGSRARSCTLAANSAGLSGGGVQTLGPASIVGSVLYGNTQGPNRQSDDLYVSHYYHVDIHQLMLGKATAKNSCIGQTKLHSTGQRFYLGPTARYDPKWYKNTVNLIQCVDKNPQFVDPGGRNYRLTRDSPCVDAAVNEDWMEKATDLDGRGRLQGAAVDMGAYESGVPSTSPRAAG